jgi:hypothetical protein
VHAPRKRFAATVDHMVSDFTAGARLLVRLDAKLMQQHELRPNDLVRITTDLRSPRPARWRELQAARNQSAARHHPLWPARTLCDDAKRLALRRVSYASAVPPTVDDALEALEAELNNMEKGEGGNG